MKFNVRRHLIIPDTQVRPGVPTDHFDWIGEAIREYKPDTVIHLGDHWDFASLSSYSKAKEAEGRRLAEDISAGNAALDRLAKAMAGYKCRKVILRGNHEDRLSRLVADNPKLEGAIGFHMLNDRAHKWEVVDYISPDNPGQIDIDGVRYAHFFKNPSSRFAVGGTISNRLAKIGTSFVQGHQQGLMRGDVPLATGLERRGIVAGSCYLHDEGYRGIANLHFRGIIVLNDLRAGSYIEMPLPLDYLCRKYEKTSLPRFLQRKYRNAKERFSLANAA
jgi:hypothetical protein